MKAIATAAGVGPLSLTLEIACDAPSGPQTPPPPGPPPTTGSWELNGQTPARLLTSDSLWYKRIDDLPAHPQSQAIILAQPPHVATLGRRTQNDWGPDFGIPYAVGSGFPAVPVNVVAYPGESDLGPHPIPLDAPIETGPDHHLCYFDKGTQTLYELFMASREGAGFRCDSCAVWKAGKGDDQRELGYTSADAAGLPVLAGLVRFDEFAASLAQPDPANQHLGHAIRFTLPNSGHGFIEPARHYASHTPYALPARPPMGLRIRVKKSLDLSQFTPATQVLMRTLQLYGAILADNGASFFFTGTADARWSEHWEAITSSKDGKLGFKSFAGALFESNVEVVAFDDSEVVTQV